MNKSLIALEVLLDKMNHLFHDLAVGPNGVNPLEVDLLKRYTRDWYEALLDWERNTVLSPRPVSSQSVAQMISSAALAPATPPTPPTPTAPAAFIPPVPPILPDQEQASGIPQAVIQPPATAPATVLETDRGSRTDMEIGQIQTARPAGDLRRLIDVNERFLFTKELFGGNTESYGEAINRFNELGTLTEALTFIDQKLVKRYNWNRESKVVLHLRDILEQRYR